MNKETGKPGLIYKLFRVYLRFVHNKIYYKKTYSVNPGNIPQDGVPTLIVSNHQNCLNDPLGVLFTIVDRKPNFITRADVFALHPIANKFLRTIGLLPAFRLDYDGAESLGKNEETFIMTERELVNGRTIIMYPEAGHQDKRWLGRFSMGYLKLAFEAAELDNFNTEIFVLPSCNHYSNYFRLQEKFMVKFGTSISLKPFYELYKTKPRTAQRQVNALVREQISNLMLNIEDLENYNSIDYIRETYGKHYAKQSGRNTDDLPQMLVAEKELVAKLANAKETAPESTEEVYRLAEEISSGVKSMGICRESLEKHPSPFTAAAKIVAALLFSGLYIFSLWPSLFLYLVPALVHKKMSTDKMFFGTFMYAFNVLFLLPIFSLLLFFITLYSTGCWWMGLIHIALIPLMCIFAWKYTMFTKRAFQELKWNLICNSAKAGELKDKQKRLWSLLDRIVGMEKK